MRKVRTTLNNDVLLVTDAEYKDLRRDGLLVEAEDNSGEPTATPTKEKK